MTWLCRTPLHPDRHLQVSCLNSSVQGGLLCAYLWVHFGAATKNTTLGFIIILKTDAKTGLISLLCTCIHHHPGAKCSLGAGATTSAPRPVLVLTVLHCLLFNSMTAGCAQCSQGPLCQAELGTFRLSFRPAVPELGCWGCDRDAPGNVPLANCCLSQPSCRQG